MAQPIAFRVFEHHLAVYKRTFRGSLFSSFLSPVLFLAAMGVALGSLVDSGQGGDRLGGVSYLSFVGPGLLAAFAMQAAVSESTFPIMGGIKWLRTFHGMLATPVGVFDLLVGIFCWMAFRVSIVAGAYLLVISAFGVAESPLALLAVPAAVLTGLSFAAPIAAFSATQENDQNFSLIFRLVVMPLFLFSGTFFPISQLPGALRPMARVTPLWHGVELSRGLVLGSGLSWGEAAGHVGYLVAFAAVGMAVAMRTFTKRLAA